MFGAAPSGLEEQVVSTGTRFVPSTHDPMVVLIVAQRVAVARAIGLGAQPDGPRRLTRSVVLSD